MAEVLLFHHALGLTDGCRTFAEQLRSAGHTVHTPDLYDGQTFTSVDDGVAHAEEVGFATIIDRGREVAEELPADLVYVGFSLGVMPAQMLAQTRPGARAAVLIHAAVPLEEFGETWPEGVRLQVHTMDGDELGDVQEARELAAAVPDAELFLYPGDRHLFTDSSTSDHDEAAAGTVLERVRALLDEVG